MTDRIEKAHQALYDAVTAPVRPTVSEVEGRCKELVAAVREDEREACAKVAENERRARAAARRSFYEAIESVDKWTDDPIPEPEEGES